TVGRRGARGSARAPTPLRPNPRLLVGDPAARDAISSRRLGRLVTRGCHCDEGERLEVVTVGFRVHRPAWIRTKYSVKRLALSPTITYNRTHVRYKRFVKRQPRTTH